MRDRAAFHPRTLLDRAARIAFTFVLMNAAAVAALGCALFRRKVWR
jgi:hypothetical protein